MSGSHPSLPSQVYTHKPNLIGATMSIKSNWILLIDNFNKKLSNWEAKISQSVVVLSYVNPLLVTLGYTFSYLHLMLSTSSLKTLDVTSFKEVVKRIKRLKELD